MQDPDWTPGIVHRSYDHAESILVLTPNARRADAVYESEADYTAVSSAGARELEYQNGTTIRVMPATDAARGILADLVVVHKPSHIEEDALKKILRPLMLTAGPGFRVVPSYAEHVGVGGAVAYVNHLYQKTHGPADEEDRRPTSTITVCLACGDTHQQTVEAGSDEQLNVRVRDLVQKISGEGYRTREDGVFTCYPKSQIQRITATNVELSPSISN